MSNQLPATTSHATVVRADKVETAEEDWGRITFYASETIGPAAEQSVGQCEILPGQSLPKHYHPSCTEVVHVLQGTISHTVEGDRVTTLQPGDTIIVPRGFAHQASNVGDELAVLLISFSVARREFVAV